jgi:hypothetical protein
MSFRKKPACARKVLPAATRGGVGSPVSGPVHLILALADHFGQYRDYRFKKFASVAPQAEKTSPVSVGMGG